jgi:predicted component of type VI protein secretion system
MLRTPLRKSPTTIGRRDGNDIVLKVDNSMGVSGQHCSIVYQNGQFCVLDEGSSYGTTLNGKTVPKGQPTPLPDGGQIGLGPKVILVFRLGQ